MPSSLRVPSALAVVLLATIIGEGCAKDEETAPPARGVFAPAPRGRQQGAEETPSPASANPAGCEALGMLVGNGLEASLDSATRRSVAVPRVSRPVATRIAVQGVGASGELSGKSTALGVAANVGNDTCTHCLVIAGDARATTAAAPRTTSLVPASRRSLPSRPPRDSRSGDASATSSSIT